MPEQAPYTLLTEGVVLVGDIAARFPQNVRQHVDVEITSAQLLALNATPRPIVAAPGAGKFLVFDGAVLFLDYNSAAYAGIAAGEDLAVKYTDGSGLQVGSAEATGFLDATADAVRFMDAYRAASGISSITPVVNAALVLQMLTGEVITGNSPLKVRTYYYVLPSTFLI
jgi:hypothetical protein